MSWIKVEKDKKEYLVSSESYEELFKHQGYKIVLETQNPTLENPKPKENITESKTEGVKNGVQKPTTNSSNKNKHKNNA